MAATNFKMLQQYLRCKHMQHKFDTSALGSLRSIAAYVTNGSDAEEPGTRS